MSFDGLVNTSVGGSFVCADYELRVTERCLAEDVGTPTDRPFDDLAGHEIIKAFINRRSDSPIDTKQVAPLTSRETVYRLGYGDRHRGATWHDSAQRVVWLMAYAQHEFKDKGDAFPYFKELDAERRLFPTERDYERLFRDRDQRFALAVAAEATILVSAARAAPGEERSAMIGGELGVSVTLVVVETLEELYVAIRMSGLTSENLAIVLAALTGKDSFDEIEDAHEVPNRPLASDELGFRCLLD
jgi:hypothetical protein